MMLAAAPGLFPDANAQSAALNPSTMPADAPSQWKGLVGTYGVGDDKVYVFEKDARLHALVDKADHPLVGSSHGKWLLDTGEVVSIDGTAGNGKDARLTIGNKTYPRRSTSAVSNGIFRITPLRPVVLLTQAALRETPPSEIGDFRKADLIELISLDPSIKLDIRYASADNFLSTPVYSQARAFLQRPAAEALGRVHQRLRRLGYGLLIHDAYRPWYVTKVFWDATPDDKKIFVADPKQGSRHNRGCAVDLSLYNLMTGKEVEMPGVYDEMSERSFPGYPGGTSRQRWHRELLRSAMEAEGFKVFETEWWHFDYQDWPKYPILNLTFDAIPASPKN